MSQDEIERLLSVPGPDGVASAAFTGTTRSFTRTFSHKISRRAVLVGLAGLGVLGTAGYAVTEWLVSRSTSVYHDPANQFVAYHNTVQEKHQEYINTLSKQGYRPTSLSIYGDANHTLYAAVWIRQSGSPWRSFHGLNSQHYLQYLDTWAKQGYRPVILSAMGTRTNALFAGVLEKDTMPFIVKHHLINNLDEDPAKLQSETDKGTLQYWNNWAKQNGYMARWITIYGDAHTPLYAGIWEQNPNNQTTWNWDAGFYDNTATAQKRLQAEVAQWTRPVMIGLTSNQHYGYLYRDDQVGPWIAHQDVPADDYQKIVSQLSAKRYLPLAVQGCGVGSKARFAAVFAQQDTPVQRQWTATGPIVAELTAFDDVISEFMRKWNIRSGALAVVKDAHLVMARGYTWAEPDYPTTQPESLFRIASCSKPLTSIAIHSLVENGLLSLDTQMQDVLELKTWEGSPPVDPRFNEIRVWHLLSHLSGYNEQNLYRETQYEAEVARALNVPLPITKYHLSSFAASKLLAFEPGTACAYSDAGFNLLGQIIEKVTGLDYAQAMTNALFTPLGLKRPRLGHSLFEQRAPNEVRYYSSTPYTMPSVITPDRPLVPYVYGGFAMELLDANAGWLASAPDYAKVLAAFDPSANNPLLQPATVDTMWTQMWPQSIYGGEVLRGWFRSKLDNGVTVIGHGGELNGTATLAFRRSDNVSLVAFFNKNTANTLRIFDDDLGKPLNQAADSITHWPDMNLFPSMGIPAF